MNALWEQVIAAQEIPLFVRILLVRIIVIAQPDTVEMASYAMVYHHLFFYFPS